MRLADAMLAAQGSTYDKLYGGTLASFAQGIAVAERYELREEVRRACAMVARSKPSSILAALPLLKLPYAETWIEWLLPAGEALALETCPRAVRAGCLIHATGPDKGSLHIALDWLPGTLPEPREPYVLPYVCYFDWSRELKPTPAELRRFGAREAVPLGVAAEFCADYWPAEAEAPAERQAVEALQQRGFMVPDRLVHCAGWWRVSSPSRVEQVCMMGVMDHLKHQLIAAICLLNSRNAVVSEREDLSQLNRARGRKGRPPLREFIITSLYVPRVVGNRGAAHGMDQAAVRRHLVRGHFKVRKTGIYWWSPFLRGRADEKIIRRRQYSVRGSAALERYVKDPGSRPTPLEAER
jgi:hypothetical protein